jgi:hypothetical protein
VTPGTIVNEAGVLATPPTVTMTLVLPAGTPVGTGTRKLVGDQFEEAFNVPATPLKVTVLLPRVGSKLVPFMVTHAPVGADVGEKLEIDGVGGDEFVLTDTWSSAAVARVDDVELALATASPI